MRSEKAHQSATDFERLPTDGPADRTLDEPLQSSAQEDSGDQLRMGKETRAQSHPESEAMTQGGRSQDGRRRKSISKRKKQMAEKLVGEDADNMLAAQLRRSQTAFNEGEEDEDHASAIQALGPTLGGESKEEPGEDLRAGGANARDAILQLIEAGKADVIVDAELPEILKDYKFNENTLGRTILHGVCLDQNLDILTMHLDKIKRNSLTVDQCLQDIEEILAITDIYGNTPLALACLYQSEAKEAAKKAVIKLLLESGSKPNVINKHTGFTPMHWCARYGELDSVEALCEAGGNEYIPDLMGFTPLDYAGKFRHYTVVRYLVFGLWEKCRNQMEATNKSKEPTIKTYTAAAPPSIFGCPELLLSPILRSTILFWACYLPETMMTWREIKQLITELGAYPECRNQMDKEKTALHAASIAGNWKKLKVLLHDVNQRYQCEEEQKEIATKNVIVSTKKDKDKIRAKLPQSKKKLVFNEEIQAPFLLLLRSLGLKEYAKSHKAFKADQEELFEKASLREFTIDFVDEEGLSPLHYACQYNQPWCAELLLLESGASIDLSCEAGFRPRDLLQNQDVREIFVEFYEKVDRAIEDKVQVEAERGGRPLSYSHLTKNIQTWKSKEAQDADSVDLSATDDEIGAEQAARDQELTDSICHKNLIKFYSTRHPDEIEMVEKILVHREQLPEVSTFAMLVDLSGKAHQAQINSLITTLVNSKFIVRMFPAIENPTQYFYITVELSQEDLEVYAEQQEYAVKLLEMDLKFKYSRRQKERYEPFRTKDLNEIYRTIIEKVIPIGELQRKKALLRHFYVHDMSAYSDIQQKFQETTTKEFMKQNFLDHQYQEYHAVTAIKNYFGERWGFQYAFMNFYTTWLLLPSLGGVACTWYQFQTGTFITLWSFAFSIFIAIWMTLFQERWKRKQNELRLFWGTYESSEAAADATIRDEFKGNEEFSQSNFKVNRKDQSSRGTLFAILNFFIMVFFVALCIASFLQTKSFQEGNLKLFAGAINAAIIGATNYLYRAVATPLVRLENIKFEEDYNNALTRKIFIFQFVNANVSIIYSIYTETNLKSLNILLLGMLGAKVVSTFASKVIGKWVMYKLKEYHYFYLCRQEAQKQQQTIERGRKSFNKEQMNEIAEHEEERHKWAIFQHLNLPKASQKYEYKRLVTVFNRKDGKTSCIEDEPFLVDQVELNARLYNLGLEYEIQDVSAVYILFSYVTLYSFICPFISCIVLLNNVITLKWERKIHLQYLLRKPLLRQNGLGTWMVVIEWLSKATIVMNCLFLFWFREEFAHRINEIFHWLEFAFPRSTEAIQGFAQGGAALLAAVTSSSGRRLSELGGEALTIAGSATSLAAEQALVALEDKMALVQKAEGVLGRELAVELTRKLQEVAPHAPKKLLNDDFDVMKFLIILVFAEHVIVVFKAFVEEWIPDTPPFVVKKADRCETQLDEMMLMQKEVEKQEIIERLRDNLTKQKISFSKVLNKVTDKHFKIQGEFHALRRKLTEKEERSQPRSQRSLETGTPRSSSRGPGSDERRGNYNSTSLPRSGSESRANSEHQNYQSAREKPRKPALTQFLEERFSTKYGTAVSEKLEYLLNQQIQIRLFRETFYFIERSILQKRLTQLSNTERFLIINCSNCQMKLADTQCHNCENDFFCAICFTELHPKENSFFARHKTTEVTQYAEQHKKDITKGARWQNFVVATQDQDPDKKMVPQMQRWQKYEKFNFPLPETNDLFYQLRGYFSFMKDSYICINNINDETQQADIVKMILDQNFKLLGAKNKETILSKFRKEVDSASTSAELLGINSFEMQCNETKGVENWNKSRSRQGGIGSSAYLQTDFNDEELLFLNRVAFSLLAKKGAGLKFSEFTKTLSLLQDGTLEQTIDLACEMLKEGRQDVNVVRTDSVISFFSCSMPQDIRHELTAEQVLGELFAPLREESSGPDGERRHIHYLTITEVKEVLLNSQGDARQILECVLQC